MRLKILHTEASTGWGGQEIRILKEAEGMRARGHTIAMAVNRGGQLVERARKEGFTVYEIPLTKKHSITALYQLISLIKKEQIDLINTHSSLDAWLGGIAGRLTGRKVLRTRHLSTPIRCGWNSRLLYGWLADQTVTTCQTVARIVCCQANLPAKRCISIPTGIMPSALHMEADAAQAFRRQWSIKDTDCVVGTTCVLRSWKGVQDMLHAAKLLEKHASLKWMIVGGGPCEALLKQECKNLGLQDLVIFTGYMDNPYPAIAAMDIFALLSTANEGVSQATLQAAYLEKPLITTGVGGLPEVCVPEKTGFVIGIKAPAELAEKALYLASNPELREKWGKAAKQLVCAQFTMEKTLDQMEEVYRHLIY